MGDLRSIVDEVEGADTADVEVPAPPAPATAKSEDGSPPMVVLAGHPGITFGDFYADHYPGLVRLAARGTDRGRTA